MVTIDHPLKARAEVHKQCPREFDAKTAGSMLDLRYKWALPVLATFEEWRRENP